MTAHDVYLVYDCSEKRLAPGQARALDRYDIPYDSFYRSANAGRILIAAAQ